MKIILYILVILLIPFKSFCINSYDYGDTLTCLAISGLKIRSEPGGDNVIGKVPYGGKVIAYARPLDASGKNFYYKSEGIEGSWVKVKYNDLTGYVFDGFLSSLPAPSLQCSSVKQYAEKCFTHSGKKNVYPHKSEGLSLADTLEFFVYNGYYLVHEERFGYESWAESLTIQGTSAEECFLLAMAIYKKDIDRVVDDMKAHPDKLGIALQKDIDNKINDFKLFNFNDGKYVLELMGNGCYDVISILKLTDNTFKISRSSGC
jgi:hypothetical protein